MRAHGEYRDFVLSRFRGTPDLMADDSAHGRDGDDGWNTAVQVIIEADSRLKLEQQAIIESDYGMQDGQLVIDTHGAWCNTCSSATRSIQTRCMPRLPRSRLWWPIWMN